MKNRQSGYFDTRLSVKFCLKPRQKPTSGEKLCYHDPYACHFFIEHLIEKLNRRGRGRLSAAAVDRGEADTGGGAESGCDIERPGGEIDKPAMLVCKRVGVEVA